MNDRIKKKRHRNESNRSQPITTKQAVDHILSLARRHPEYKHDGCELIMIWDHNGVKVEMGAEHSDKTLYEEEK